MFVEYAVGRKPDRVRTSWRVVLVLYYQHISELPSLYIRPSSKEKIPAIGFGTIPQLTDQRNQGCPGS